MTQTSTKVDYSKMTGEELTKLVQGLITKGETVPKEVKAAALQALDDKQFDALMKFTATGDSKKQEEFHLVDIPKGTKIFLGQLLTFANMPLPHIEDFSRPVNDSNVYALKLQYKKQLAPDYTGKRIPELLLQGSNKGIFPVGGGNRKAAMLQLVKETFTLDKNGDFLNETDKKEYYRQINEVWTVEYTALNAKSIQEVLTASYKDNMTHGAQMADNHKSKIALALIDMSPRRKNTKGQMVPSLSVIAAANEVGISDTAVFRYRSRLEAAAAAAAAAAIAAGKEVKEKSIVELADEDEQEVEKLLEEVRQDKDTATNMLPATGRLFAAINTLATISIQGKVATIPELSLYFTSNVKNEETIANIQKVVAALNGINLADTPAKKNVGNGRNGKKNGK